MGKDIIDLKPEERENGEIVYETTGRPIARGTSHFDAWMRKALGITLTLAGLAVALIFFFYVVVPLIVLILAFILLRKIYHSLVR
jgi:hypothetical protein